MSKKLIYEIVSHPVRAKMIALLAEKGALSFSELKSELKISTGSLYHHLYVLGDFIERDERRRYRLNKEGRKLISYLEPGSREVKENYLFSYFQLIPLFYSSSETPIRFLPLALSIMIVAPLILGFSHLEIRLLFLLENLNLTLQESFIIFYINYFALLFIIGLFIYLIYKVKVNLLRNFINLSISILPLLFFALIFLANTALNNFLGNAFNGWLLRIIFLFFQIWSVILLANSIKITNILSSERAFIITLFIIYIGFLSIFIYFI